MVGDDGYLQVCEMSSQVSHHLCSTFACTVHRCIQLYSNHALYCRAVFVRVMLLPMPGTPSFPLATPRPETLFSLVLPSQGNQPLVKVLQDDDQLTRQFNGWMRKQRWTFLTKESGWETMNQQGVDVVINPKDERCLSRLQVRLKVEWRD